MTHCTLAWSRNETCIADILALTRRDRLHRKMMLANAA
jgi:hypothetical protein